MTLDYVKLEFAEHRGQGLSVLAKIVLAMVRLCGKRGLHLSNPEIAKLLEIRPRLVSDIISLLLKKGLLHIHNPKSKYRTLYYVENREVEEDSTSLETGKYSNPPLSQNPADTSRKSTVYCAENRSLLSRFSVDTAPNSAHTTKTTEELNSSKEVNSVRDDAPIASQEGKGTGDVLLSFRTFFSIFTHDVEALCGNDLDRLKTLLDCCQKTCRGKSPHQRRAFALKVVDGYNRDGWQEPERQKTHEERLRDSGLADLIDEPDVKPDPVNRTT